MPHVPILTMHVRLLTLLIRRQLGGCLFIVSGTIYTVKHTMSKSDQQATRSFENVNRLILFHRFTPSYYRYYRNTAIATLQAVAHCTCIKTPYIKLLCWLIYGCFEWLETLQI